MLMEETYWRINAYNRTYVAGFEAAQRVLYLFLRMHCGAHVPTGLLFDRRGDDGGMGYAGLMEAVRRRGHHVRGEAAGHQADGTKEGKASRAGFCSEPPVT